MIYEGTVIQLHFPTLGILVIVTMRILKYVLYNMQVSNLIYV